MASKVAVIDLGSNTFHLLICEIAEGRFSEIFRQRIFVGLAEGGISVIKPQAIERASVAFADFQLALDKHAVDDLKIVGTAALRSASNAHLVQEMSEKILGQPIEIIVGDREAELIYKGVSLLVDCRRGDYLIMDIGGGSTEFIIIRNGEAIWSKSYNIGVAVLHELFHESEPMSAAEQASMRLYLDEILIDFKTAASQCNFKNIIGASGSFEVVVSMNNGTLSGHEINAYATTDFSSIEQAVLAANFDQRAAIPGMPASRVKLIVVAFVLIRHVLDMINPERILVSPYALKEGVISEML